MRYPAIIEGGGSDYGIWFPDIDGIGAMGYTIEEVLANASEVLSDYAIEMERDGLPLAVPSAFEDVEIPEGCALTSIQLVRAEPANPIVRLNFVLDAGVAKAVTSEARWRGMSRRKYIEWMTKTLERMDV
jgi:predicted RNase H-like HicB family nuclease